MRLRWLSVIILITSLTPLKAQDQQVSAILDTLKHSLTVETDINIESTEIGDADTLWFYFPMYTFAESNNTLNDYLLKMGHTDFYFRHKSQYVSVQNLKVSLDGKIVLPFKKLGTNALIGITADAKSVHFSYTIQLPEWYFGPSFQDNIYLLQDFYPVLITKDINIKDLLNQQAIPKSTISMDLHLSDAYIALSNGRFINSKDKKTIKIEGNHDLIVIIGQKPLNFLNDTINVNGQDTHLYIDFELVKSTNFKNTFDKVFQQLTRDLGSYPYPSLILKTTKSKYYSAYRKGIIIAPYPTKSENIEAWLTKHLTELWLYGKCTLENKNDEWLRTGICNFLQSKSDRVVSSDDLRQFINYKLQGLLPAFNDDDNQLSKEQIHLKYNVISTLLIQQLAHISDKNALLNVLHSWEKQSKPLSYVNLIAALEKETGKTIRENMDRFFNHPEQLEYERNLQNNDKVHCPLFSWLLKEDNVTCNPIKWAIYPAYNDNDGWMTGLTISNAHPYQFKKFIWSFSPMYSFKQSKLLGQLWAQYDLRLESKKMEKIRFHLGLKSFDHNYNRNLEYTLQFVKVSPSVQLFFNHTQLSKLQSSIAFRWIKITEQQPIFNQSQFNNLEWNDSNIFQLDYNWSRDKLVSNTAISIVTEFQQYNKNDQYIKLIGIGKHQWMYKSNKNIGFRFFAGGFILNSQRHVNSFQNQLTKGSLALIQHGFNDYTFDEYFLARETQYGFQDRQVSISQGGGFKTPVGSAHQIGMSNNFAASINLFVDVPFKTSWFPLQAYFDVGIYNRYFNQKSSNYTMYNGGLSLNYNDVLAIYVPFIFSEELGSIYKEVHKDFFSRISFSINLNQFYFWQNNPLKKHIKI